MESKIEYTKSGCKIVYVEEGKKSDRYRLELIKRNGELITKKIYEQ